MKKSGIRKYLILLFMCVLMMVPATTTEAAPKLSKTEVTIQVGEKVRLKVKNTTKTIVGLNFYLIFASNKRTHEVHWFNF